MDHAATADSALGPCLGATLVTDRLEDCIDAWCSDLHQQVHAQTTLQRADADRWGVPGLTGARVVWLANALGEPWLRLIEDASARPTRPFLHRGWLALELAVADVDALAAALADSTHFRLLGPPADLEVSDQIRAMQVVGPAGEVLYLTQIKGDVPGFDLPRARCAVDRLFIPVLLTADREETAGLYRQFPGTRISQFDTRITVINRARGLPVETRHPVATVQLAGQHLIEIDQLNQLRPPPEADGGLPSGIALVTFATRHAPSLAGLELLAEGPVAEGPQAGKPAWLARGEAGERFELILT